MGLPYGCVISCGGGLGLSWSEATQIWLKDVGSSSISPTKYLSDCSHSSRELSQHLRLSCAELTIKIIFVGVSIKVNVKRLFLGSGM